MSKVPFRHRFDPELDNPIATGFPNSAKVLLLHLIEDLSQRGYIAHWQNLLDELARAARTPSHSVDYRYSGAAWDLLESMNWIQIYSFCERVYDRLLTPVVDYQQNDPYDPDAVIEETVASLSDVQEYFEEELNQLLLEENLAYQFVDGQFQRRGRPQTQKNIEHAHLVLSDPDLEAVRVPFVKARKFFDQLPEPDIENCIKEALISLEACVEIITQESDFRKAVNRLQGNEPDKIPSPIAQGMIKLHGYRGGGQGVAHAALTGNPVSIVEAELTLSLVAAYITYLADKFITEKEIPF